MRPEEEIVQIAGGNNTSIIVALTNQGRLFEYAYYSVNQNTPIWKLLPSIPADVPIDDGSTPDTEAQ